MTEHDEAVAADLIDQLLGVGPGDDLHALRHARAKATDAIQRSQELFFQPELGQVSLQDRLSIALYACALSRAQRLGGYYRKQLASQPGVSPDLVAALEQDRLDAVQDARLRAMLVFTRILILTPVQGDKAALQALQAAGLQTPDVVTVAQLIAYLSYQIRMLAGLLALQQRKEQA
ncbi:CMD domain-containing protein [Alcaligenes sp. Marseille-Q7550]